MNDRVEVVVTGGGTAGHVHPAIAVGEALVESGYAKTSLRYVGTRRGVEGRLVPAAGFEIVLLPGRGVKRRLGPQAALALCSLAAAYVAALVLLARWRPRVVVAVGGFGSVACGLAAVCWRLPLVVVNVDAVPGAANRLLGRFAAASAVAYEGTPLRRAEVTGAPVRTALLAVERSPSGRAAARAALELPDGRLVLAVVGGSLGARRLNDLAVSLARSLAHRGDLVLYHVSGRREHETCAAASGDRGTDELCYRLVAYEERMAQLYVAADLVVCRSGASTVAELCATATPSVLVPLPGAPGDHQARNAERLAREGAAVVVTDADASADRVWATCEALLADEPRREAMSAAAHALAHPDAARRVAGLVRRCARKSPQ